MRMNADLTDFVCGLRTKSKIKIQVKGGGQECPPHNISFLVFQQEWPVLNNFYLGSCLS
jgi:hypothetical protein